MKTRNWARWPLLIALWTLIGALFAGRSAFQAIDTGAAVNWRWLAWYLLDWELYLLLLPLILLLVEKLPLAGPRWSRRLPIHLVAGVLISLASLLMSTFMTFLGAALAWDQPWSLTFDGFWNAYRKVFGGWLFFNLGIYWMVVAVGHALRYYQKFQERELRNSELEKSLAKARLQALQMQLQPHFLFNTLHAISSLMHKNVEAAETMLARLGEMLRLSLDDVERQEVSLVRELELLGCYLEIQKIRFPDRLEVEIAIANEALDCEVPRLILQPLVENAFRHGVEKSQGPGRIGLGARRVGDHLEMVIEDSGPGIAEPVRALREGIGLSNTRRRLEELYGAAASLDLVNPETGGLRVVITLPFRASEEARTAIRASEFEAADCGIPGSESAVARSPG